MGNSCLNIKRRRYANRTDEMLKSLSFELSQYTLDELRYLHSCFMEEFPTGYVTVDDFTRQYHLTFPEAYDETLVEYMFKIYDDNDDGLLGFDEFTKALGLHAKGNVKEKLRWAFRVYDIDNSGFISREEMKNLITAIRDNGVISVTDARRLFDHMDTNKDGMISMDEFLVGIQKLCRLSASTNSSMSSKIRETPDLSEKASVKSKF